MKIKYCLTEGQRLSPCESGWGSADSEGIKGCSDEPMEDNCRRIVDSADIHFCPYCGGIIPKVKESHGK